MKLNDLPLYTQFALLADAAGIKFSTNRDDQGVTGIDRIRYSSSINIPLSPDVNVRNNFLESEKKADHGMCHQITTLTIQRIDGNDSIRIAIREPYIPREERGETHSPIMRFGILDNTYFKNVELSKIVDSLYKAVNALANITEVNPDLVNVVTKLFNAVPLIQNLDELVYEESYSNNKAINILSRGFWRRPTYKEGMRADTSGNGIVVEFLENRNYKVAVKQAEPNSDIVEVLITDKRTPKMSTTKQVACERLKGNTKDEIFDEIIKLVNDTKEGQDGEVATLLEFAKEYIIEIKLNVDSDDYAPW